MLQNKSSWSLTVRDVAYIGIMIATLEAAKLSLSFIPNVELVTFLLILYTLAFGKKVLYAAFAFVGVECLIWEWEYGSSCIYTSGPCFAY